MMDNLFGSVRRTPEDAIYWLLNLLSQRGLQSGSLGSFALASLPLVLTWRELRTQALIGCLGELLGGGHLFFLFLVVHLSGVLG